MNYDDLPRFERFHRKKDRRPSARHRRSHAPNCMHKTPYHTAGHAEAARARQIAAGAPFLRVYHCPDCRAWHLTHKNYG